MVRWSILGGVRKRIAMPMLEKRDVPFLAQFRLLLSLIPVVVTILVTSILIVRVLSAREQGLKVAM